MSNRERWVVYPLLFLALMASLSDKIVPPTTAKFASVTCGELTVVTAKQKPVLVVRPDASEAGELLLYQDQNDPYLRIGLDEHQQGATLEGWSLDHQTHFKVQAHPHGAMTEWSRNTANRIVAGFSPYGPQAGLWGLDLHDQLKLDGPSSAPGAGAWGIQWNPAPPEDRHQDDAQTTAPTDSPSAENSPPAEPAPEPTPSTPAAGDK